MNTNNNFNTDKAIEGIMQVLTAHNEEIKRQHQEIERIQDSSESQSDFNDESINQLKQTWKEVMNARDEIRESNEQSRRSEKIAIKSAEFAFNQAQEMKKHIKITDVQADEMAKLVGDKSKMFANVLYPEINNPEEFSKKIGYIRRGMWTIIKRNVNGSSSGSYKHTKRTKFESAMEYINLLNLDDYLAHRNFEYQKIKPFVFEEKKTQEEIDIEEMIRSAVNDKNNLLN